MKRLIGLTGSDLEQRVVIATFRLVGDRVQIDGIRNAVEMFGLDRVYSGKVDRVLSPKDGAPYYEALDVAFSNSSRVYVDTVPDE